jgi:Uma2 family endonuclease
MIQAKDKLPRTAAELFEILPEGLLCQAINNTLYMTPAPNFLHQIVCRDIMLAFSRVPDIQHLGEYVASPVDVYLDAGNVFQPDIIFIAKENMGIIKHNRIKGAPDLVIEILSPGNTRHDTVTKKAVYERTGVKEYFIVDPATRRVSSYFLKQKKYVKQPVVKGKMVSKLLASTVQF